MASRPTVRAECVQRIVDYPRQRYHWPQARNCYTVTLFTTYGTYSAGLHSRQRFRPRSLQLRSRQDWRAASHPISAQESTKLMHIIAKASPGESIDIFVVNAIMLARWINATSLECNFNDTEFLVYPTDHPNSAANRWSEKRRTRI